MFVIGCRRVLADCLELSFELFESDCHWQLMLSRNWGEALSSSNSCPLIGNNCTGRTDLSAPCSVLLFAASNNPSFRELP